jgi:hypothetical protein
VELADHVDKSRRTVVFRHDLPQSVHTDDIKGFGEIHKNGIQALVLFLAFLLQLSGSKDHSCSESTLVLRQQTMLQVLQEIDGSIALRLVSSLQRTVAIYLCGC